MADYVNGELQDDSGSGGGGGGGGQVPASIANRRVTFSAALPATRAVGSINIFTLDVDSGLSLLDESDSPISAVTEGDVVIFNGTTWKRVYRFSTFVEALIAAGGGSGSSNIIDMRAGRPDISGLTLGSDEANAILQSIGLGNEGIIYVAEESSESTDGVGTWAEYSNTNFDGVLTQHLADAQRQENHFYYNSALQQWYRWVRNTAPFRARDYEVQARTPQQVLGTDAIFLYNHASESDALHSITEHDEDKTYYAEWEGKIWVLDNDTYTAPTTGYLEWTNSARLLAEELDRLEQILDGKSEFTADDVLDALPNYLKVISASLEPPYFDPNAVHSRYIANIEVINGTFADTEELVIYFNGIPVETSTNFDSSTINTINVNLTASQRNTLALALAVAGEHTITVGFEFVDSSNQQIYLHNIEVPRVSYPLPLGVNSLSFSPPFLNPNDLKSRLTAHVGVLPDSFPEATQVRIDLNGIFGSAVTLDRSAINKPRVNFDETQLASIKSLLEQNLTELSATLHFLDSNGDSVYNFTVAVPKAEIDVSTDGGSGATFAARAERVFFNALTGVGTTEQSAVLRSGTPISVRHGSGDPNLLSTVDGQTGQIQILKRGIYELHLDGNIDIRGSGNTRRTLPRVRIYSGGTLVSEVDDHYHRASGSGSSPISDQNVSGDGIIYVPSDDYIVTVRIANELTASGNPFDIDAGWSLTFTPFGVAGEDGGQGVQGRFDLAIYRNYSADSIPTDAPTGGTFTYLTGMLTDVPTGWSINPSPPASGERTVKAITTIDYANPAGTTLTTVWSAPIPETGEPGTGGGGGASVSDDDLDTSAPDSQSRTVAPSQRAVAADIARVEALIPDDFEVIEARESLPDLPAIGDDTVPKWKRTIGVGRNGILWSVEEYVESAATEASSSWGGITTTNYDGVKQTIPPHSQWQSGHFFYHRGLLHWYEYYTDVITSTVKIRIVTDITSILGSDAVWLGHAGSSHEATVLVADATYDSAKKYYVEFLGTVWVLASYTAGTTEVKALRWTNTYKSAVDLVSDINERIAEDQAAKESLERRAVDLRVKTEEVWTDSPSHANFDLVDPNSTNYNGVDSGSVPTGSPTWDTSDVNGHPQLVIVRMAVAEDPSDYRLVITDLDNRNERDIRLDNYVEYARDPGASPTYKYFASPTRALVQGRIKIQIHQSGSHTEFKGDVTDGVVDSASFSGNLSPADNTIGKALKTVDDLTLSGGITDEENRFERIVAGGGVITNIRFRVAGQSGVPDLDDLPALAGSSWQIDYRQVAGKLIVFDPNTSPDTTFEINLQDLIGIRTALIGESLNGSVFLIANKTNRIGSFTANPSIAQVFPTGQTLAANSMALITMNSLSPNGPSQTFELIVQPLGGEIPEDDKETLQGAGAPAGTLGEIGDTYIRTSNGQTYKKTAVNTWTPQVNLATQEELDALQAELDIAEESLATAQTTIASLQTRLNEIAGGDVHILTPRRSDHLVPRGPVGDEVFLTQDTDGPSGEHEFVFSPYYSSSAFGISRATGFLDGNLNGRVASRDRALISGTWVGIAFTNEEFWALDDGSNNFRNWATPISGVTRTAARDISVGTGVWITCAEVNGTIYAFNRTGNVIRAWDTRSRSRKPAGDRAIGGSDVYTSMIRVAGRLYLLNNTKNKMEVFDVNSTTGALTPRTSSDIELASGDWAYIFYTPYLNTLGGAEEGATFIYAVNTSNVGYSYSLATKLIDSDYQVQLPQTFQAAFGPPTPNGTFFLDNAGNKLTFISVSRLALPGAVFDDDGIGAIWVPFSGTRRHRIHVAYLSTFAPAALDQVDWAFAGSTPPSGNSRMGFLENQTHGGKTYAVYVENEADAASRPFIGDPLGMSISMRFGASGYIERDAVYSGHLARKRGLYTANREGKYENYSLEVRDALQNLPEGEKLDVGGGDTPRRVATLPSSPYTLGDEVYLTTTDGSNAPGRYYVFDTSKGYERAVVNREPLVVLTWDETRAYADVTLPANYGDYRFFKYITMKSSNEIVTNDYPIVALQDARRDGALTNSAVVLGEEPEDRIHFNRTTRVIQRTASSAFQLFVYMELY